jgi:hypothetical protein
LERFVRCRLALAQAFGSAAAVPASTSEGHDGFTTSVDRLDLEDTLLD